VTIIVTSTPYLTHPMQHRARPPLWGQFITISNLQTQYPTHHSHSAQWQINQIPLQTRAHLGKPKLAQPVKKKSPGLPMAPEGPQPCSQKPTTALYTAPYTSIRHRPILFTAIHFSVVLLTPMYLKLSPPFNFAEQKYFACTRWSAERDRYILTFWHRSFTFKF
jgi:hypothetical protein